MSDGRHSTHHDERDLVTAERSEQRAEIGYVCRYLASRPARRISSAKRASAIAFRNRSSTDSFKFSRMRVRSMSILYASTIGSWSRNGAGSMLSF